MATARVHKPDAEEFSIRPEVRAFLTAQGEKPPKWERTVEDSRREMLEESLAGSGTPEPVAAVDDLAAAAVPARLYCPKPGPTAAFVWLHGGGWTRGDLDCYDSALRRLANRAGCAVLSVDYRLAPEHVFPAALDDAWAATEWAAERFDKVAVGGDSAGGTLAAAVALRARDRRVRLALQLLVYPVLDYAVDQPHYHEFRRRYAMFSGKNSFGAIWHDGLRWSWETYVPNPTDRRSADASPLRAHSFHDLAPALVLTAEHDILRKEAETYVGKLMAAKVPVRLVNYEGQIHGFFHLIGIMDDARTAVDESATALREALAD